MARGTTTNQYVVLPGLSHGVPDHCHCQWEWFRMTRSQPQAELPVVQFSFSRADSVSARGSVTELSSRFHTQALRLARAPGVLVTGNVFLFLFSVVMK